VSQIVFSSQGATWGVFFTFLLVRWCPFLRAQVVCTCLLYGACPKNETCAFSEGLTHQSKDTNVGTMFLNSHLGMRRGALSEVAYRERPKWTICAIELIGSGLPSLQ